MKYVNEFRQADDIKKLSKKIDEITTRDWTIMEVCGGQTHSIVKYGIHDLLPKSVRLIHGPGCPVCVTPTHLIDHALFIASLPSVILCTFGDMLRVRGSNHDLISSKAKGSDVRIIHSPLEAVIIAQANPDRQVVLFAVGFETTAPACALAASHAKALHLTNFSLLASHVLVPEALEFLLSAEGNTIQGFLAAGHVCTVAGYEEYPAIAKKYKTPIIITGFEPFDILQGIYLCICQLENGLYHVENQYSRSVRSKGNIKARETILEVFKKIDRSWRGIGVIPKSGLDLNDRYKDFDASLRFPLKAPYFEIETGCISGQIMQGKKKPTECPLFGKGCTPEMPQGAPMVSSEGACSAYYQYTKRSQRQGASL